MVAVILGSKWMKINPDNVATPMAASFGDLITLALLAFFGRWAYAIIGKEWLWESCNFLFWSLGGACRYKDERQRNSCEVNETLHDFFVLADSNPFVLYLVDLFFVCLIPLWVFITSKHPASQILLRTGWEPIITAMFISRCSPLFCIYCILWVNFNLKNMLVPHYCFSTKYILQQS